LRNPDTPPSLSSVFVHYLQLWEADHVSFAMLIPPLARAAHRPGLRASSASLSLRLSPYYATRVFTSSPLHRKDVHGQRPLPGSKVAVQDTKAAKPVTDPTTVKVVATKTDPLLQEQTLSNKEQRKADWAIMKEMSQYLWPKDNLGTRFRVGLSVGLLVGAKLLNVQVPFYFKSIVDSMNIDFLAVGGTAWTVAGSMIMACKLHQAKRFHPNSTETT
jgi:ATP-binding cassette subfamily B (MDR/TAP) protein 7